MELHHQEEAEDEQFLVFGRTDHHSEAELLHPSEGQLLGVEVVRLAHQPGVVRESEVRLPGADPAGDALN